MSPSSLIRLVPAPVKRTADHALIGALPPQRAVRRFVNGIRARVVGQRYGPDVIIAGSIRHGRPSLVVDRFDALAEIDRRFHWVTGALDAADVPYVALPKVTGTPRTVVVSARDASRARAAVATAVSDEPVHVQALVNGEATGRATTVDSGSPLRAFPTADGIRLFVPLVARDDIPLGGSEFGCSLEFWQVVTDDHTPRADGGYHLPGTLVAPWPNPWVGYLTPAGLASAAAAPAPEHWPTVDGSTGTTHIFAVDFPVDVVYTWVDGNDPAWQERRRAAERELDPRQVNETAIHPSRYASRDELRYSLRSLEMYANWVRRVYIVTDGQTPAWLDLDNPRVQVIDHREIFADTSVLPTFNSHAIESRLHHIPGLAEHYLYLNDDVFFARPVGPETFFHGNGIAKFFRSKVLLDLDPPDAGDLPVTSAAKQNRALIGGSFERIVTTKFKHTPHPQVKSVLNDIEKRYADAVERTTASRFRRPTDVSVASALHHYYAFMTGRAVPGDIAYFYRDLADDRAGRKLERHLNKRSLDVFCLNETVVDETRAARISADIRTFMDRRFPVPSSFESRHLRT